MSATRNICEIIPKHLEQTEHLQERNSSSSSRGGEVVHGKDAPLRNELGSLPSSYSNFVFPQYRESR